MNPRIHTPFPSRARRLPVAQAAVLALAMTGWTAQAQQAEAKKDDGKVETVVITATKRIQPLQSTPIAISSISGSTLEQANLNNLEAISTQVPTVNFRTNASNKDSALFVRGVGTISTSPGVEPTVSTVLDGVVTARPGQATLDLVEIDRIEILRGPQGTLFGKNASAGVINIVSRAPGKEFGGYVDLSAFQGNEARLRAGVWGEMMPNLLRGSLSVMTGKYDGIGLNATEQPGRMAMFDSMKAQRWARPEALEAAALYNALAKKHGLTPTRMALAFCYTSWRVASTIIGVTTKAQLDECLDAWGTTLAPELLAEIDKIRWTHRDPAQ